MPVMRVLPAELMEKLPNGMPRASVFEEYRRIMGVGTDHAAYQDWLEVAVTIMLKPDGFIVGSTGVH